MDSKDFRLLALLNENARQSFRALGRRLSLSAPAVRERLRRLEARGIVQGYWVSVDPAIFRREDLLVSFGKDWSREDAVRASNAPDVASQMLSPARSADIQSPFGTRTPLVVPFQVKTTSWAGSIAPSVQISP